MIFYKLRTVSLPFPKRKRNDPERLSAASLEMLSPDAVRKIPTPKRRLREWAQLFVINRVIASLAKSLFQCPDTGGISAIAIFHPSGLELSFLSLETVPGAFQPTFLILACPRCAGGEATRGRQALRRRDGAAWFRRGRAGSAEGRDSAGCWEPL